VLSALELGWPSNHTATLNTPPPQTPTPTHNNKHSYLISNAKDQTAKLWDVRAMRTPSQARDLPPASFPRQSFDYRWQPYPGL